MEKIVEGVADIADDKKLDVVKVGGVLTDVVEFVLRCFRCKNAPKSKVLLRKSSVELRKTRNSTQAIGVCAKCGANVRGFIPAAEAKASGFDIQEPIKPVEEPKRKRKRERETFVSETEAEPSAKEVKTETE